MCIKEPSYSQRQNVISYDVIFEKDSTMSQISISLFPDQSFQNLYVLSISVNVLILMMQRNMTM